MKTQKDEILQVVRGSNRHMTADEIYLTCRSKGVNVSMATVYRNLRILADKGVILRVAIPEGPDIFDKTTEVHSHKVCDICGEVSDINVGDLKEELEARIGMSVTGYDLCVHYICPKCEHPLSDKI